MGKYKSLIFLLCSYNPVTPMSYIHFDICIISLQHYIQFTVDCILIHDVSMCQNAQRDFYMPVMIIKSVCVRLCIPHMFEVDLLCF